MASTVDNSPETFNRRHRPLALFLRLVGVADLLAVVVVFLPTAWQVWGHEVIGMGDVPPGRIVGYLARSTSLLYAVHGALLLVLASDLLRYQPVIRCYGSIMLVAGAVLIGIDILESMPVWWTVFEGAAVIGIGVVILTLCHQTRGSKASPDNRSADRTRSV